MAPNDRLRRWGPAAALALLALFCCSPLLEPGANQEALRPITRVFAAWQEIGAGDLYPRWLTLAYFGKGAPVYDFYPPAFWFLAAYAHAAGVPLLLSVKLLLYAAFLVGALGVLRWIRPHLGEAPAFVAAVLYLFAPYHFLDVYVRCAFSEFASIALFPWLFVAVDALIEEWSVLGFAGLAAASAGIVLSHFLGALMIAPFAAAYAVLRCRAARTWRPLGRIALAGVAGAALCAFYWLPSLVEVKELSPAQLGKNFSGYLVQARTRVTFWAGDMGDGSLSLR
jgi:uncharacterized membrane protein